MTSMTPLGLWGRVLALSVLLTSTSWAQLSLWTARGTVDFITEFESPPPRPFGISYGTALEISFLVDRSVLPSFSDTNFARYRALSGMAKIGEQAFDLVESHLIVANSINNYQAYFYGGYSPAPNLSFDFSLSSGLTWKDDVSIPISLPPLLQFNVVREVSVSGGSLTGRGTAYAKIDSFTLVDVSATAVP